MSKDPYIDVKREVEISLASIQSLARDHRDLYNPSTSSSAVLEAQEELRNTLSILEPDAEDLEESVRVVEDMGERWGLSADEVSRRRQFVQKVKSEVDDIRNRVHRLAAQSKGKGKQSHVPYRDSSADLERGYDEDNDEMRRWEAQEQEMLVKKQDDTLGLIQGTLHTLASQAGLMGSEVEEQMGMIDGLNDHVEHTDSRLQKVRRTMEDFIRRNEETKSGWCIVILIIILGILLLLVILT
ncbi:hypothetical protein B9479_006703 [Cryptococcus floricola]|uniref:t-SNARE coiled-coil homology domain-containing protein n=1 Tax=Cryptococcus floricola TaxID=2591691 RepID=A0A5D3AMF4_9TREE|nr:hypothetical protein B9479_006703 [Cryptococcus floricola]